MKTAILYYSQHHGNTKKLLDAIKAADPEVVLIDVTAQAAPAFEGSAEKDGSEAASVADSEAAPAAATAEAAAPAEADLSGYDRIGIASGIYFGNFAKQVINYAAEHLPEGKPVFFISTQGRPSGEFLKGIREVTQKKNCPELGAYNCQGFDTFGPFKLVGGIAKGHPTKDEIEAAVKFYRNL